jgi:DNA-directed RNA polymerase specialized sigma subunit
MPRSQEFLPLTGCSEYAPQEQLETEIVYLQSLVPCIERFDKRPDADMTALRGDLVKAFSTESGLEHIFPGQPLAPATERLLEVCLSHELRTADRIRDWDERLKHEPHEVIRQFAAALPPQEQARFMEVTAQLTPMKQNILLRRLHGEGLKSIALARKSGLGTITKNHKVMKAELHSLGYPYEDMSAHIEPEVPAKRESIFDGLREYLPSINQSCEALIARLPKREFDRIATSLFITGLTAENASYHLWWLGAPHESVTPEAMPGQPNDPKHRVRRSTLVAAYTEKFGDIAEAYGVRPYRPEIVFTRRVDNSEESNVAPQAPYEFTDAACKDILSVIARVQPGQRVPGLESEEEARMVQAIELGMWAEIHLALAGEPEQREQALDHLDYYDDDERELRNQPTVPEDMADLQEIASEGRIAFQGLLYHNVGMARHHTRLRLKLFGLERTDHEMLEIGLTGVMRAIRKFDGTIGKRFATYARPWIVNFAQQYTYKELHVAQKTGDTWGKILFARASLAQKLGHEAKLREVAAEVGLTEGQVYDIQQQIAFATPLSLEGLRQKVSHPATKSSTPKGNTDEWLIAEPAHQKGPSRQEFKPKNLAAFRRVFANTPRLATIIKLHFQDDMNEAEIATKLQLPLTQIETDLKEAKARLAVKMSEGKLQLLTD